MKKKLVGLLLSAMTAVSSATMLSACGPDEDPGTPPPPPGGPGYPPGEGPSYPAAPQYRIDFSIDKGAGYDTVYFNSADELATQIPPAPTKPGMTFLGWYSYEGEMFIDPTGNVALLPEGDDKYAGFVVLYPKYQGLLSIRYETFGYANNPQNPTEIVIQDNEWVYHNLYTLTVDYSDNEDFLGWYTTPDFREGTEVNSICVGDGGVYDSMGTLTLYAKIQRPIDIEYVLDGGTNSSQNIREYVCFNRYTSEREYELYAPTKENYAFAGWYTDASFTHRIESIEVDSVVTTLYAKWDNLYNVTGHTITSISSYASNLTELHIPSYIDGVSITAIGADICKDNTTLERVSIASGIRTIGAGAFSGCTSLVKVELPNTLVAFDSTSFESSTTLAYENGATHLVKYDNYSYADIENLVVADTVVSIEEEAFIGNKVLQSIDLNNVTSISRNAFNGCTALTSVKMSRKMTLVGENAFRGCRALESVEWTGECEGEDMHIEKYAFFGCCLLESMSIPETCMSIGEYAFSTYEQSVSSYEQEYSKLKTLTFEGNSRLDIIGDYAFANTSIESLSIPKSCYRVGQYAFNSCMQLKSVDFNGNEYGDWANVIRIQDYAFAGCYTLESFTLPEDKYEVELGSHILSNTHMLVELTIPSRVVARYKGEDTDERITDSLVGATGLRRVRDLRLYTTESLGYSSHSVEVLRHRDAEFTREGLCVDGDYIYANSTKQTLVGIANTTKTVVDDIPSTVTAIGSYAFAGNTNITKVCIPSGVTSIPVYCFEHCTNLKEVVLHSGITTIDYNAFAGAGIESITLTEGIESIGSHAFFRCDGLSEITLPSTVTFMGDNVFEGCTSLTTVDMSQSKITSIGTNVFEDCSSLVSVYIPTTVVSIGMNAFYRCENLTTVNIPTGSVLESIDYSAFSYSAIESISLPSTFKTIGNGAFAYCRNLRTFTVAEGAPLSSIGEMTFYLCSSLRNVVLPSTATFTDITIHTFGHCTSLISFTIPTSVTNLTARAFDGCVNLAQVRVLNTSLDASTINNVLPQDVEIVYGALDEGDDTTKFENVLENNDGIITKTVGQEVWLMAVEDTTITELVIPDNVTHISDYALFNLPITSVTIPEGVVYIGAASFAATHLTSVTLPSSLIYLGESVFENCESLESVDMSSCVLLQGSMEVGSTEACSLNSTFDGCTSLTTVSLPTASVNGIKFIGTFRECASLTSMELPDYATKVDGAFRECTSLTTVSIGSGVTVIDDYTFKDCPMLTTVTYTGAMEAIGEYAFENCVSLEEFRLADTITTIGAYAFYGSGLRQANLPEGLLTLGNNALTSCRNLTELTIPRDTDFGEYYHYLFAECYNICHIRYLRADDELLECIPTYNLSHVEVIRNNTDAFTSTISYEDNLITLALDTDVYFVGIYTDATFDTKEIVSLPANITKIADYALYRDSHIVKFVTNNAITYIGKYAFSNSTTLNQVVFEGTGEAVMGESAFSNSKSLTKVSFDEYSISIIGRAAFYGVDYLRNIHIPNSVTTIDDSAFANISNLEYVYIGEDSKLTYIGKSAFKNTTIRNAIYIPRGITTIKEYSFSGAIYGGLRLSSSAVITAVEESAFNKAHNLDLTILRHLDTIGVKAFEQAHFTSNESLVWRVNRVVDIGDYAFSQATTDAVLDIIVDIGATNIMRVGHYAFSGSYISSVTLSSGRISFGTNAFASSYIQTFTVEESVSTDISESMFEHSNLVQISLNGSIDTIDAYAFKNCESLNNFKLPSSVSYLGASAFESSGLYTFDMSEATITNIYNSTFKDCTFLHNYLYTDDNPFTLSDSVRNIGDYAFYGSGLSGITLNAGLTTIGKEAFNNCTQLTSVEIPSSVTTAGEGAFANCYMLSSVTFADGARLQALSKAMFNGSAITSITIPTSVAVIGENAFGYSRLESIYIPNSVTTIEKEAFIGINPLTEVTFATDSILSSIGDSAFYGTGVSSISIPASVESIGEYAFSNSRLTSITLAEGLESIGDYAFSSTGIYTFIIPSTVTSIGSGILHGSISALQVCNKSGLDVEDSLFEDSKSQLSKYYEYITSGEFTYELEVTDTYICLVNSSDKILASTANTTIAPSLLEGVTIIGNRAFYGNSYLNSITIPATVREIDDLAFAECRSLSSVTFESDSVLDTIGVGAFKNIGAFGAVESIDLPSTVKTIGDEAFYGANITSITLPLGLESIGSYAFRYSSITEIHIPSTVEYMGVGIFYDCDSLTSITFDDTIELDTLGCIGVPSGVDELVLPEGITSFGDGHQMLGLDLLVLPSTITDIPVDAIASVGTLVVKADTNLVSINTHTIRLLGQIVFLDTTVPSILQDDTYNEFFSENDIYVLSDYVDEYNNALDGITVLDISTLDSTILARLEELLDITL